MPREQRLDSLVSLLDQIGEEVAAKRERARQAIASAYPDRPDLAEEYIEILGLFINDNDRTYGYSRAGCVVDGEVRPYDRQPLPPGKPIKLRKSRAMQEQE